MLCSCSGFKGFWIKSFAPASMAERSCDCVPTEETIMISASLSKSIISRIAALPSFTAVSYTHLIAENTMITVDVQNVGITEIMRITVKQQIVSAGNCIGFDPVAGQNGVLHAIIAYK